MIQMAHCQNLHLTPSAENSLQIEITNIDRTTEQRTKPCLCPEAQLQDVGTVLPLWQPAPSHQLPQQLVLLLLLAPDCNSGMLRANSLLNEAQHQLGRKGCHFYSSIRTTLELLSQLRRKWVAKRLLCSFRPRAGEGEDTRASLSSHCSKLQTPANHCYSPAKGNLDYKPSIYSPST